MLLSLISCASKDPKGELAINAYYYYEFIDHTDGRIDQGIIEFLDEYFQRYDYVMNEESMNAEWPFYMEIEKGSKYYKADLTPPHYSVHIMRPFDEWEEPEGTESYRIEINFLESNDEGIRIHFLNKKKQDGAWVIHSDPQPASFMRSDYSSQEELFEVLGKTLIRDIFK
ncbi:MAG: hypothetical protein HKN67_01425 [Saprospiraceae bacterium]|nr:hypothetical protein [Saprospiraceae bacterium]